MKQYNILHIMESLYSAGTPNKLLMLFRNIDKQKYKIILVIFGENNDLYVEFEKVVSKIIQLKKPYNNGLKMILALQNIIKKEKIDLVNTHYNRANILGGIASIFSNVPFIQNEHGIPRGGDAKKFPLNIIVNIFDNIFAPFRAAIICNSYTVKKNVIKKIKFNRERFFVVNNAIDISKINLEINNDILLNFKKLYGISENHIVLGSVGGFIKGRDYLTFLKAVKKLKKEFKFIKYFIAGWGDEKDKIQQKIIDYNLENNVIILGYFKNIPLLLNVVDIYLDAVLIASGIGLALLEAMYFGLPIIGIMRGDKRDIVIKNNYNGFILDKKDINDIYSKIKYLIINKDKRLEFGNNSKKLVIEKYNEKIYANNITKIYNKILLKYS